MEIVLETERLFFRKFTLADTSLLYNLNSSPNVLKYIHEAKPILSEMCNVLNNIILPQYTLYNLGRMAVHIKSTQEFIGWCGLKYIAEKDKIDLGYRYFPDKWGKGFATEAAKATIHYGLSNLQLSRIIAQTHEENIASQKVITNCGLVFYAKEFSKDYNCNLNKYQILK